MTEPVSDTSSWAYITRTFQALGYRFAVRSTHEGIGRYIDEMYSACAVKGEPSTWYSIVDNLEPGSSHELRIDDVRMRGIPASRVFQHFVWHVNQSVIAHSSNYVLVHAAAAARDGIGVLLPGAMDAGKTTLVAGLVRRGWSYLTDEAAAIDPDTLLVHPFPKPLTIDNGSFDALADLRPEEVDPSTGEYLKGQWHVPPATIHDHALSGPVASQLVVFPRYVSGAPTAVEELNRSEALVELLGSTFGFHDAGRRNLMVLGRLVTGLGCFRLTSGRLDEACEHVDGLLDTVSLAHAGGGGA